VRVRVAGEEGKGKGSEARSAFAWPLLLALALAFRCLRGRGLWQLATNKQTCGRFRFPAPPPPPCRVRVSRPGARPLRAHHARRVCRTPPACYCFVVWDVLRVVCLTPGRPTARAVKELLVIASSERSCGRVGGVGRVAVSPKRKRASTRLLGAY
jgi:hypothetical protein